MAVISRAIPTLLRGISQSSDALKQPDHADIQDNADSNPVLGLTKRSGLQYLASLSSSTLGNVHIQTINSNIGEQYVAVFSNGNVKVFDLNGVEITVDKPDGTTYLNTSNPRSVIKTVTIADFTFVVNTSIKTAMDTTLSGGTGTKAIIFINQATANTTYSVTVDNVTVSDNTSGDSTLSTSTIANDIKTGLGALVGTGSSNFTIERFGPVLYIRKNDGSDFSIKGADTQGNTKMTIIKNSVQRFTDLPTVAPNGYVVEVKGDDDTNFDNYYVKFVTNNTTTEGTLEEGQWEETVEAGIPFKYDYGTMPHVLIRKADGEFIFARVDGDLYSAPTTSGTYIQDDGNSTDPLTAGTLITVTSPNHGLSSSDSSVPIDESVTGAGRGLVRVVFTSGNASQGTREFITVVDANTFTFVRQGSQATSGTCRFDLFNNFTLPKWAERTVGDLISAPDPSFIGKTINNVFFFRNRLGFLSGDNVILSRVSEFFNFFPETVVSVLDNEPIDVAASHTKVAILKSAVTMGERLILFSEQTQFVLASSADNLTPKTANVLVATEFESSAAAQPIGSGSSIYFLTQKGSFAGIREYIIQGDSKIRDAANITIHVPKLIPSNIFKMAVSTNQDILVLLGTDNTNKLYVYRWLYGADGQKALSSWFTYTINANRSILNIDFIGTNLFAVIEEANKVTLEKIPFETEFNEANATFEYHLDHKVTEATTGVTVEYPYTDGNGNTINGTRWTVPYRLRANMNIIGRYLANGEESKFIDPNGVEKDLVAGSVIQTTNSTDGSTSTITATGDYRNSKFIIGEPYEMHYRFSKQRLTEQGAGSPEYIGGRLQIHHFYIKYEDAGFFKVEVTPENRDTSTYEFTGNILGAASSTIGQINLDTGTFRVPIMSKSDRVDIDVKNNTFLPTRLASAEYEGVFHMRSRRI